MDDQMTRWLDDKMTRWPDDWMTGWHDDRKLCRRLNVWYILFHILNSKSISISKKSFLLWYKHKYIYKLMTWWICWQKKVSTFVWMFCIQPCFKNKISKLWYIQWSNCLSALRTHSPIVKHMASGWQGEGWHIEVGLLLLVASLITGTV